MHVVRVSRENINHNPPRSTMSMHSISRRLALRFSQAHRAAGVVIAAALVTAACGDGATAVTSPVLNLRMASASATASSFTVLANAAVTCTNGTITGDVGTFLAAPTGSFNPTNCPVTGTVHLGDAAAIAGYKAFLDAYAALARVPRKTCTVLTGTLDGITLAPGVYCFDAAATLTGVLTLSGPANGTWVFLIGTSGTGALTGTNFSVVMAGGAVPCNVTWWVAQAVTMTDSRFVGTIMAGAAITLTRGTFDGNAWSKADVTITGTTVTGCNAGSSIPGVKEKCNQGVGNGFEGCDPGNSLNHNPTNDENGGTPGKPGRKGP
jgi:hypothetical protein